MTEKAKNLGKESVSPTAPEQCVGDCALIKFGLTKRELFAVMAMKGMGLSTYPDDSEVSAIGIAATKYADALLEELVKTDKTE